MAILKITTDLEFLRKKSKPVTEFNARLHQIIDDMRDTLKNAHGAGLAAVQVGILYRVCLVVASDGVVELVNPEIINSSNPKSAEEGCLSVPDSGYLFVSRPHIVTVRAQDRFGNTFTRDFEKMSAVCACHETDHLDGILFTDKAEKKPKPNKKKTVENET